MNYTFNEQVARDDISTSANTQQSTSSAQNTPSQERAHEYKQRLAESVQTQSDSTGKNDTTPPFTGKPKAASHSDFHRNSTQEQRNNNGSTPNADNAARSAAPEQHYDRNAENRTSENRAVTNDNECSTSGTERCETAPTTAEPKRRYRKAQPVNTSPISEPMNVW